jgi:outer membrane protein TolC
VLPRVDLVAAGGAGALSPSAGGAVGGLAGAEAFPHITGGAVASMPLGNRDARGRRDRAEAELARFEAERDQARARVLGTVSAAVEALAAAEERARLADLAVGYTAETLAAEEALLQAGRGLARDVLEARAAHASAQAVSVAARVDHAVALARLRAARALP